MTRQRAWQIKVVANGKCAICAKPRVNATHCDAHRRIAGIQKKVRLDRSRSAPPRAYFCRVCGGARHNARVHQ